MAAKGLIIGRIEHSTMALLIAKIVPDKAQSDDNANALARFVTQYGAILASAPTIKAGDRTLFCRFIVKNKCLE
ncbi:hypothetical protein [Psychrobacter pacificensis]|uniref:hypothetical protein n=1 Tax=Psychrobacter pacificensis TaxID=112002 RepID=UPI001919EA9A|nr:hypothetical protein [Psychrobacter pacificensis]